MNCFDNGESIEYEEIPCCDNPKIEIFFKVKEVSDMFPPLTMVIAEHACINCGSKRQDLDNNGI